MNKKVVLFSVLSIILLTIVTTVYLKAQSCCTLDCCCPPVLEMYQAYLDEYICVCVDGNLIDGSCYYIFHPGT